MSDQKPIEKIICVSLSLVILLCFFVFITSWWWKEKRSLKELAVIQTIETDIRFGDVRASVNGKDLSNPVLSVLEFSNTGNVPIVRGDFEGPIRVLVDSASIANPWVLLKSPGALQPSITLSESQVLIQPLRLNPGDVFRLNFLTDGSNPNFEIQGRIAGVNIRQEMLVYPLEMR